MGWNRGQIDTNASKMFRIDYERHWSFEEGQIYKATELYNLLSETKLSSKVKDTLQIYIEFFFLSSWKDIPIEIAFKVNL